MLRALIGAMTLLMLPLGPLSAGTQPDPGGNAALKYWQAFATLPKFSDSDNKTIRECLTSPLDKDARALLTRAEYSLQMLQRGAALRRCDWGMSYEDGVYALLPQADAARVLTSLACLRGRLRIEEGKMLEAVDDLVAAMALGRHVSQDGTLITLLVGYGIEHRLGETVALSLPKLDAKTTKELKTRIEALPPGGSASKALMTCEKENMDWFINKVKGIKTKENLLSFLSFVAVSEGKPADVGSKARAFFEECGGSGEGIVEFAEEALPSYAAMAKCFDLPPEEFAKEFKRESTRQAGNPVFKVFFPALGKVYQSKTRAEVRRAMLSAAIAVQLDGQDALKHYPDPIGGGRFEYVPFAGGFELRSKLKGPDDKSMALTVGHR